MNVRDKLVGLTGDTSWEYADGPESGCGIDYWFVNSKGHEAYANNDNDYITISINGSPKWNNEAELFQVEVMR